MFPQPCLIQTIEIRLSFSRVFLRIYIHKYFQLALVKLIKIGRNKLYINPQSDYHLDILNSKIHLLFQVYIAFNIFIDINMVFYFRYGLYIA